MGSDQIFDVLIIDPDTAANPGDFVVAWFGSNDQVIVRKYKQLSSSKSELVALNEDWAGVQFDSNEKDCITGTVVHLMRDLKIF